MTVAARHPPVPRETLERCALRAQLRGDPMLGTAFPAARLLLVEQPGPWGRRGLADSRFDPEVAVALERRASAARVRVHAIRRPGRTPRGTRRHWALVDTRDGARTALWGGYDADAELLDLPLDGSVGEPDPQPIYLVCAHGKHDACCALRGRSVAAALAEQRPAQVWESTHLGGDRFASNVLVLPSGLLYGRLLPFAAIEFVAAAERGEVIGALLRGRIGLPPTAQAALGFAHEHLALPRLADLQLVDVAPPVDGVATVRIASPHGQLDVTVALERVPATGLTCGSPGRSAYIAFRPLALTPVR